MDPVVLAGIERLDSWRADASSKAHDGAQQRAAQWIYAATLAVVAADQLRLQFSRLSDEIQDLKSDTPTATRYAIADRARELAHQEVLVGRMIECAGILRTASDEQPSWLTLVVRRLGGQEQQEKAQDLVRSLAEYAEDTLKWVGAREKAPTPSGIEDVERAIRAAVDEASLNEAQAQAIEALNVIDAYALREARERLGGLRATVASTYGLELPSGSMGIP